MALPNKNIVQTSVKMMDVPANGCFTSTSRENHFSLGEGSRVGSHKNTATDHTGLRAELDGLVAHLYELTDAEFRHILGTFPLDLPG